MTGYPIFSAAASACLHGIGNVRGDGGLTDLLHRFFEQLPVLCPVNCLGIGADQPHAVFCRKPSAASCMAMVSPVCPPRPASRLSGFSLRIMRLSVIRVKRLEIDLVRQRLVGHDRGGVGIAKHHIDARIFQNAARLRAGIVKLRRLPDDDRAGADHQHFFDIVCISGMLLFLHHPDKSVKQKCRIQRTCMRPPDETAPKRHGRAG